MKIKIGTVTEDIVRMNNELYKNLDTGTILTIDFKNTDRTVEEIDELFAENFTGDVIFIADDGDEETYADYVIESIRKSYDENSTQISVELKKEKTQVA